VSAKASAWQITDGAQKPFGERLASLRGQLEEMRRREPTVWNIADPRKILQQLQDQAEGVEQQAEVLTTLEQIDRWERLQQRYLQSLDESRAARVRDQELATIQRRREYAADSLAARFDASGVLQRAAIRVDDQPTYSIQTSTGVTTHLVVPAPGLNLEPFVGSSVGLIGRASERASLPSPLLYVQQLVPLR
jgi:hypothetical protein